MWNEDDAKHKNILQRLAVLTQPLSSAPTLTLSTPPSPTPPPPTYSQQTAAQTEARCHAPDPRRRCRVTEAGGGLRVYHQRHMSA